MLAREGQRLRERAAAKDDDEEEDEYESDDDDLEEELGFISPLETVNTYLTFKVALNGMCPHLLLSPTNLSSFSSRDATG